MGRLASVALIAALLLALTIAASPLAAAAGPAVPVWTKGDFWEYRGSFEFLNESLAVTLTFEVLSRESVDVRGTLYETYKTEMTTAMSGGGFTISTQGTAWFRRSDIAPVRIETEFFGSATTQSWDPPVRIEWPLEVGNSWSGTATVITESDLGTFEDTESYSMEVEMTARVEVPAGTFDTYVLKDTGSAEPSRTYYAARAGNYAKMEGAEALLGPGADFDLEDYKFQNAPGGLLPNVTGISVIGIDILWLILVIIFILVVMALILMRRRRPPLPTMAPPPPTDVQTAPPAE